VFPRDASVHELRVRCFALGSLISRGLRSAPGKSRCPTRSHDPMCSSSEANAGPAQRARKAHREPSHESASITKRAKAGVTRRETPVARATPPCPGVSFADFLQLVTRECHAHEALVRIESSAPTLGAPETPHGHGSQPSLQQRLRGPDEPSITDTGARETTVNERQTKRRTSDRAVQRVHTGPPYRPKNVRGDVTFD
jgi:hypothetical protein